MWLEQMQIIKNVGVKLEFHEPICNSRKHYLTESKYVSWDQTAHTSSTTLAH